MRTTILIPLVAIFVLPSTLALPHSISVEGLARREKYNSHCGSPAVELGVLSGKDCKQAYGIHLWSEKFNKCLSVEDPRANDDLGACFGPPPVCGKPAAYKGVFDGPTCQKSGGYSFFSEMLHRCLAIGDPYTSKGMGVCWGPPLKA